MAVSKRLAFLIALGIPLVLLTHWKTGALFWLLVCLLVWLFDVIAAPSPRHLAITRSLPHTLRQRAETPYTVSVKNPTKRKYHAQIRDAWPPSLQALPRQQRVTLDAQSTTTLQASFTPQRKGTLHSDAVTVRSYGPLGLGARQFSAPIVQQVQVLPEFRSAKYLPSHLKTLRRLEGNSLVMQRGQGSEFDSLREYVPGDDVRDIEWHSSARLRTPVVKTWRPERDRNVIICLDSSRSAAVRLEKYPRLDASMEAALLLGALAGSAGDRVHLIAFDNQIRFHIQPDRGAGLITEMAQALADLQVSLTEANWSGLSHTLLSGLRQRSLVVILTGLEGGAERSGLMPMIEALSSRHHVLVANSLDPELERLALLPSKWNLNDAKQSLGRFNPRDAFLAAAAMAELNEHEEAGNLLPLLGGHILNATPENLPPNLADAYISLKRRGQI